MSSLKQVGMLGYSQKAVWGYTDQILLCIQIEERLDRKGCQKEIAIAYFGLQSNRKTRLQ